MNDTQIKNGEIRIFPFYKGEYMGKSEVEFGFSNTQSARKYMKPIPDKDIYDSIGGYEKYFQENAYLYKYSKTKSYWFNPKSHLDTRRTFEGCYDADYAEKFYLKDIPNAEKIKQAIENLGFLPESDREQFKAFEEKYEFFPSIYVDDKPFIKAKTKYINDNVEFRKGIVKISVEYLDE